MNLSDNKLVISKEERSVSPMPTIPSTRSASSTPIAPLARSEKQKEKLALKGRIYYEKMKANPEFMALKRQRAKERRQKIKAIKELEKLEHQQFEPEATKQKPKNPNGRPRKY